MMSDPRDNFFSELFNQDSQGAEAIRFQRQLAFEERIIKRVFKECGIKISGWGKMANECRDMTGHNKLNFSWFNSEFSRFPGVLCGRRIPRLHELTMADLFKIPKDGKNRLLAAVAKNLHRLEINTERRFIMCFPVVRTMLCAHNHITDDTGIPRVQWICSFPPTVKNMFTVEHTSTLFNAIGSDWYYD